MPGMYDKSASDWDPAAKSDDVSREKLFSTTAKDNPDCVTATNELKNHEVKKSAPKAPFGPRGKDF